MEKTISIFISMVILFSLINIDLALANTNFHGAVIFSNRTPVSGADVEVTDNGEGGGCLTKATGYCDMLLNFSGSTSYDVNVFYPDQTPFGGRSFYTDANGNAKVTICPEDFQGNCDVFPPTYSNNVTYPINPVYSPTASYNFNITWGDNYPGVDKVILEFNGQNYTDLVIAGSWKVYWDSRNYSRTFTGLAAGTYNYKWYANDTANNWASTDSLNYTISKATPTGSLSTSSWNVTYPTSTTVSCSLTSGDPETVLTLKRDGSIVSSPSETITLGYKDGGYFYTCEYPETQNYSASTLDTHTLIVNKGILSGSISGSNVIYPTSVNVFSSESNSGDSDTIYYFYRDDILISQSTGSAPTADTAQLGATSYTYKLNATGGTNYTTNASIATKPITVGKGSIQVNLYLNGTLNSNKTYTYPQAINATGTSSVLTPSLYRDGVSKGINEQILLGNGTYAYKVNATGNANYSDNSTGITFYALVNKGTPSFSSSVTTPISYETHSDYQASESNTGDYDCVYILLRNGTQIATGSSVNDTAILGAGNWNYIYYTTGCTNYTSSSNYKSLDVNKKNASIGVNPTNQTQTYEDTPLYQYCTGLSTLASCKIYRNGVEIANNTNPRLAAGTYNYVANISDNQNYTSYQATSNLTINPKNAQVTVNPTTQTIVYGASTNQYCTSNTSLVSCKVYRNNAEQTNNSNIILGVGTYTYTANISDSANYTNYSTTSILNVSQATPTCTLSIDPSSPITYGTYHTSVCSCSENEGTVKLYRNNTDVTLQNNTAILLGANTYNYTCNVTSSQNYTSASKSQNYIIIKASRTCNLNTDKNWTRTYDGTPSSTTCSVSAGSSDGSMTFTMNGGSVSSPDLRTNAGTYNYACQWGAGVNYSACTQQTNILKITVGDTTPPVITIQSPKNTTYYTTSIPLTFTVSEPASWCGYSLDGTANKTLSGCANTTLTGLSYITHNIIIYANNTSGNMGASIRVYFTVKSSGGGGGGGGGGRPMLWTG